LRRCQRQALEWSHAWSEKVSPMHLYVWKTTEIFKAADMLRSKAPLKIDPLQRT